MACAAPRPPFGFGFELLKTLLPELAATWLGLEASTGMGMACTWPACAARRAGRVGRVGGGTLPGRVGGGHSARLALEAPRRRAWQDMC